MPKSCYLLLLVFGLLLSGCGGGSGGSAFGEAPAITQEQSQVLEEVRLKAGDVPAYAARTVTEQTNGSGDSSSSRQSSQLIEEWSAPDSNFTVYYSVYDRQSEAKSVFESSTAHHPLQLTAHDLRGGTVWETQDQEIEQIYLRAGRVIVNLNGSDPELLERAAEIILERGQRLSDPAGSGGSRLVFPALRGSNPVFTIGTQQLSRYRWWNPWPSYFAPMQSVSGLPTAYVPSNREGNAQNNLSGGESIQESPDVVHYSRSYQLVAPANVGGSIKYTITNVAVTMVPGYSSSTYGYNDGRSYTGTYVNRCIYHYYYVRNDIDADDNPVPVYRIISEKYYNNYQGYTYRDDTDLPNNAFWDVSTWGVSRAPGKFAILDEALINQTVRSSVTHPFAVRGLYLETPSPAPQVQSGEEVKLAFKITGVPTLPAGDGLDEAGWAPLNPKWRLVIYNEEGGEVRILSGQAASLGVNQIPLEVTWDGKDSQGNPAEAGNYTYKLFCLEQSDGLGYGVAQGNLTVGEPVLELYDEDDNLIASSEDDISDRPDNPYMADIDEGEIDSAAVAQNRSTITKSTEIGTLARVDKVFLKDHNSRRSLGIILKNGPKNKGSIEVQVNSVKSHPDDYSVTLEESPKAGDYIGHITFGPDTSTEGFAIKRFANSFSFYDAGKPNDALAFFQNLLGETLSPLGGIFANVNDAVNVAKNNNLILDKKDYAQSPNIEAIKAAGYENIKITYSPKIVKSTELRFRIQNQAENFYFSSHGAYYISDYDGPGINIDPIKEHYFESFKEIAPYWNDNAKIIVMACCSVLSAGNFNEDERFCNKKPPATIIYPLITNKQTVFLGYNSTSPLGPIIDTQVINEYYTLIHGKYQGRPVMAWLIANANNADRFTDNACAIYDGNYYFIKYRYEIGNEKFHQIHSYHYDRKIYCVPQAYWPRINSPHDDKNIDWEKVKDHCQEILNSDLKPNK